MKQVVILFFWLWIQKERFSPWLLATFLYHEFNIFGLWITIPKIFSQGVICAIQMIKVHGHEHTDTCEMLLNTPTHDKFR